MTKLYALWIDQCDLHLSIIDKCNLIVCRCLIHDSELFLLLLHLNHWLQRMPDLCSSIPVVQELNFEIMVKIRNMIAMAAIFISHCDLFGLMVIKLF